LSKNARHPENAADDWSLWMSSGFPNEIVETARARACHSCFRLRISRYEYIGLVRAGERLFLCFAIVYAAINQSRERRDPLAKRNGLCVR